MRCLIYDTETTSLDTENGYIQELAWAVYDVNSWRCLLAKSYLLDWPTAYQVDPMALATTGLTREFCSLNGSKPFKVFNEFLQDLGSGVDYLCGHNAIAFDYPMLKTNIKRVAFDEFDAAQLHIDTMLDCPYPATQKIMSLKYLALDHGYILSDAHQALADVFACKAILSKYDFDQVLEIAKTPMITLSAKVDWADSKGKERIKNARFYWNPNKKLWEKRIREFHLPGTQMSLGNSISLSRE